MPRTIDKRARLEKIAMAVEEIAAHNGFGAVTFRRIADQLGSSTTVVTHLFATRDEMLGHVLDRSIEKRREAISEHLDDVTGGAALRAIVEWAVLEVDDHTHRFWVALVSGALGEPVVRDRLDRFNTWWDERLRTYAAQMLDGDDEEIESLVDAINVVVSGLVVGGVETSGVWPIERRRATLDRLLNALAI